MENMEREHSENQENKGEVKGTISHMPKLLDANMFASWGNPHGFKETKVIGEGNDRLPKTTKFKDTEFSTALEILPNGNKKLSIHFPHIEQGSSRGGSHAGLTFVFDKDVTINHALVENFLPYVVKFREENFTKEGALYRINTNNPANIVPIDVTKPILQN